MRVSGADNLQRKALLLILECACGYSVESGEWPLPCPRCSPPPILGFVRVATPEESAPRWSAVDGYTIVVVDEFVREPQRWLHAKPGRWCAARLCRKSAVVSLRRAPNHVWSYCPEHLYGRRLIDGRLEAMIRVFDDRLPHTV